LPLYCEQPVETHFFSNLVFLIPQKWKGVKRTAMRGRTEITMP
jgi:hypothetical protein